MKDIYDITKSIIYELFGYDFENINELDSIENDLININIMSEINNGNDDSSDFYDEKEEDSDKFSDDGDNKVNKEISNKYDKFISLIKNKFAKSVILKQDYNFDEELISNDIDNSNISNNNKNKRKQRIWYKNDFYANLMEIYKKKKK